MAGVPELLPPSAIVPKGDVGALASRLSQVAGDPAWMMQMSARNLLEAKAYRGSVLRPRRIGFYQRVRESTEAWLHDHGTN